MHLPAIRNITNISWKLCKVFFSLHTRTVRNVCWGCWNVLVLCVPDFWQLPGWICSMETSPHWVDAWSFFQRDPWWFAQLLAFQSETDFASIHQDYNLVVEHSDVQSPCTPFSTLYSPRGRKAEPPLKSSQMMPQAVTITYNKSVLFSAHTSDKLCLFAELWIGFLNFCTSQKIWQQMKLEDEEENRGQVETWVISPHTQSMPA